MTEEAMTSAAPGRTEPLDGMEAHERGMLKILRRFFGEHMPATAIEILDLKNTSLGRSRENWSFDLVWSKGDRSGREPLILRRDPVGGLVESDRATEFAVLKALKDTAVLAPAARWLDAEGKWFGRPSLIMRREPGTCHYYVLNGSRSLDERLELAHAICDLLARVHLVDWRQGELVDVFPDPGPDAARVQVDEWEAVLQRDRPEPYPEIELAAQWLRATAPRSQATVLVHGDYKPGNVLIEGRRVVALLDWELAHLGDPLEDLGWVTQPLRRREHMIPGVWEREQILERYRRTTGFAIGEAEIRWWNVFATFRTAVMQVTGLRSFLDGRSGEPYRPTARVLRVLLDAVDG